jgi:hypothetical protein
MIITVSQMLDASLNGRLFKMGNTWPVPDIAINPDDIVTDFWKHNYVLTLSEYGPVVLVNAECEQDAFDYAIDWCEEKQMDGLLLSPEEVAEEEFLDDLTCGGNHGRYLSSVNIAIFEIPHADAVVNYLQITYPYRTDFGPGAKCKECGAVAVAGIPNMAQGHDPLCIKCALKFCESLAEGYVCSNCGDTITVREYSCDKSDCCHSDTVPEEEYEHDPETESDSALP